ncbi:MAG: hypothetical protein RBT61_08360 [Candidatus Kapabacteria bacterium]|jgi:hypothetical protein|nr:hypothetical protein [Candidatus Kapabacteria bacterium]
MKNLFNAIVIALALFVAYMVYFFFLGNPDNFNDPETKHEPKNGNIFGTIYTGGPLVGLLLSFVLISITFTVERSLSINKAKGKGNPANFIKNVTNLLSKGIWMQHFPSAINSVVPWQMCYELRLLDLRRLKQIRNFRVKRKSPKYKEPLTSQ